MNMVRTTISLPADLHEELRLRSVKEKKSVGMLVAEKFKKKVSGQAKLSAEERIKRDFELFDEISSSSVHFDAEKAVREERDRDNA